MQSFKSVIYCETGGLLFTEASLFDTPLYPPSLWESGVKGSYSHRRQWHRNQSQSHLDVWDPGCGLLPAWDELDSPVNQRTLKCQHSYPTQLMGKLSPEEMDLTFTRLSSESHAKNKMKHCVPGHHSPSPTLTDVQKEKLRDVTDILKKKNPVVLLFFVNSVFIL